MTDQEWCDGAAKALGVAPLRLSTSAPSGRCRVFDGTGWHVGAKIAEGADEAEAWAKARAELNAHLDAAIATGRRCADFRMEHGR